MQALYMDDCYLSEFDAEVIRIDGNRVFLDKTAFYPAGGGQPNDTGKLVFNGAKFSVVNVAKEDGKIAHHVEGSETNLEAGDAVHGVIDWKRRYKLMRMHTAAHIIDAVLYKETGALCTGNQLDEDKSRIDFSLDEFNPEKIKAYIETANEIAKQGIEVKIYYLTREEAMKIPGIVKLAKVMPPNIDVLRIVEIPDVDIQADGGTQVANTKEIGTIEFVKVENRGKNNRRVYYTIQ